MARILPAPPASRTAHPACDDGQGTIHTIDCDTLESFAEGPERWLDVA
jgi:hypothetical protein